MQILQRLRNAWGGRGSFADPRPAPFIVGHGRSGTTLLRLMLDAHPKMAIPPETGFVPRVARLGASGHGQGLIGVDGDRDRFLLTVIGTPGWKDFGIDEERFEHEIRSLNPFSLTEGTRMFYSTYAEKFGKVRYGDKTPGYGRRMTVVESVMPEARFINLIRDGRDVVLSRRGKWFEKGESIEDIARGWAEAVRAARTEGRKVSHYLEVSYENLVNEPEATLQRICSFVDLDYSSRMLTYHESAEKRIGEIKERDEGVSTREQRLDALSSSTKPPDKSKIGRWRTELSNAELIAFDRIAGNLLAELGYERFPA